jgi:hypothetical protein
MRPAVGTLAWAEQTGGRLDLRDRLGLLAAAVKLQIGLLPAQLRWRLGLDPDRRPALDPADVRTPDSSAARAAEAHCREVSPPYLVNHCLRAWLWARLLGAEWRLRPDEELLYVACLLHDLGLTPHYSGGPTDAPCFAVRGAEAARALVAGESWPVARGALLAEAITLHLNVSVGREHGVEAHLLNAATALDVTGLRCWEVPPSARQAVVARVPRLQMKRELWPVWKAEADAHPECRGAFLNRYLQFGSRVRAAPFGE